MATLVEQPQPFPGSLEALAGTGDAAGAGGWVGLPMALSTVFNTNILGLEHR